MLSPLLLSTFSGLDVVIVRHRRVADYYQAAYLDDSNQTSETIVKSPNILSLKDYLQGYWHHHVSNDTSISEQLLNTAQSLAIWNRIVSNEALDLKKSAFAYEAWTVFKEQQVDYLDPSFNDHSVYRTWQTWARRFEKECHRENYVDVYRMIETLQQSIVSQLSPQTIGVLGFESPTPFEQSVLTDLRAQGHSLRALAVPVPTQRSQVRVIQFSDSYNELNSMAHWAYQRVDEHPNETVVCAIPELNTQLNPCINTFQRVYHERFDDPMLHKSPFSIPFETTPLVSHPIIDIALTIIQFTFPITLTTLSRLLGSPYLGHSKTERFSRAGLDRFLRQQGNPVVSLAALKRASDTFDCATLAAMLEALKAEDIVEKGSLPSQWVAHWKRQLTITGWALVRPLSDKEQYCLKQWSELLDDFCSLDGVLSKLDRSDAINLLTDLATRYEIPLQLADPRARVQLIDVNDIPYCYGDIIWVLNAHPLNETPRPLKNPFIPLALKESSRAFSTLSFNLERVSQHSQQMIVSSTQPLFLSMYKATIDSKTASLSDLGLKGVTPIAEKMANTIHWESFQDHYAPHLVTREMTVGGSDLIKQQAICPFKAFADYRLFLKKAELKQPSRGPNNAEKAIYLHAVLETIWDQLHSQQRLNQLSEIELQDLLRSSIHETMQIHRQRKPYDWRPIVSQLEEERVYTLLKQWFTFEKERPDFSVKAVEYPIVSRIGPLTLRFTIDRIDQLSDGSLLLIDYKSSLYPPTRQHWMSQRPIEPQLPLYLLSTETMAQGITWAHLHPQYGGKFIGISANNIHLRGIQPIQKQEPSMSWDTLVARWRTHLEGLALQFYEGYAAVDPKEGLLSCRHCQYALLCRIRQSKPFIT